MDDLPPLEDMSLLVEKVKEKQQKFTQNKTDQDAKTKKIVEPKTEKLTTKKINNAGFGGMKRGFLSGSKPSKPKQQAVKSDENIDYVLKAPKNNENGDFVFSEVQEEMKKGKWVTDDLLKNVENNPKLLKKLSDPKFSQAIKWMEKDPKAAQEFYKNDNEVQEFFMEFYKILGSHFTKLGADQPQTTEPLITESPKHIQSQDEVKMQKIMSDPEIRAILTKPAIQNLFTTLRNEPEKAQTLLNTCDPRTKADIQKLVNVGLLGIESH